MKSERNIRRCEKNLNSVPEYGNGFVMAVYGFYVTEMATPQR